jgi:hypothetical protein
MPRLHRPPFTPEQHFQRVAASSVVIAFDDHWESLRAGALRQVIG